MHCIDSCIEGYYCDGLGQGYIKLVGILLLDVRCLSRNVSSSYCSELMWVQMMANCITIICCMGD